MNRDRLELIRLLAAISEMGTLSGGAQALAISQPSASRLLSQLEASVGAKLVHRSTRALTLTSAGARFLAAGRRVLESWEQAVEEVAAEQNALCGHLRVTAPMAAGEGLLALIAARFLKRHPGVTMEWRLSDESIDPTDTSDLWIRVGDVANDGLVVRELWRIKRTLVAPASHGAVRHPQNLERSAAILAAAFVAETVKLSGPDDQYFDLKQRVVFKTDNLHAVFSALEEGLGYTILPFWLVQRKLKEGSLVSPCPLWTPPDITLSLAYLPGPSIPRRLNAFIAFVRSELAQEGGAGPDFIDANDAHDVIVPLHTAAGG